MDEVSDPADELIAMFGKITTSDHESLVAQFAKILNTDLELARFFLEASSWSVEQAVHTYLAETTNGRDSLHKLSSSPVVTFLSDLSRLQAVVFEPGAPIDMEWSFRNDGDDMWPADTRLVFVDGERMHGTHSFNIRPAMPGETVTVHQRITAPPSIGTFAGTWRLACSAGYFGDPLWIIITVGGNHVAPVTQGFDPQFNQFNDQDMMDL
jgi:hypothetical protein